MDIVKRLGQWVEGKWPTDRSLDDDLRDAIEEIERTRDPRWCKRCCTYHDPEVGETCPKVRYDTFGGTICEWCGNAEPCMRHRPQNGSDK
jgi:hypothetical protein